MRTTFNLFLLLALIATLFTAPSCSKEGPTGPAGADGNNGQDGTDGNANVRLYLFETDNIFSEPNYNKEFVHPDFNQALIDSSLVLVYWQIDAPAAPGSWRLVGTNLGTSYSTRWSWTGEVPSLSIPARFFIDINNASGDGEYVSAPQGLDVTWDKVKFIIAPANVFSGKREVDFTDYDATMLSLGLNP